MRSYADEPLTLADVSQLLWSAQGITGGSTLRAAPSAGATYPLEVYVVAGGVARLAAGIYRYNNRAHELDEVAEEDKDWRNVVRDFYLPFDKSLVAATASIEKVKLADEVTNEVCPECGKPVVVKNGRFGKFLACSGYPDCKYTRSFQAKTGVHCPEPNCAGELVQRRSKKGRTFYGCSYYPECRFTISPQPLPQPCPQCGSLLTVYRKNQAKCIKCDYRGKVEATEKESSTQTD